MPNYDRVHLSSCLADAVRSAVENLRDDPAVSHLAFHRVIDGGEYRGETLYSIAYSYLEDGMVRCTCGAVPRVPSDATSSTEPTPDWREALSLAERLAVSSYAEGLARIEAALTDENDCSTFWLTVSGGADPVTVTATPDQVRAIFALIDEQEAFGEALTPLLVEDPETGDVLYAGDLAAGIWLAEQDRHPRISEPSPGVWRVELCDDKRRREVAEWGQAASLDGAWRFALGAMMGPVDAEYDERALREALATYPGN